MTMNKDIFVGILLSTYPHVRMIPPALLETCPRLVNFYKIMKMVRKKEHLTDDGINHILRLRDKMMLNRNAKDAKEYEV